MLIQLAPQLETDTERAADRAAAIVIRGRHPIAYERGALRWEQTNGDCGIQPISPRLDEDLRAIRVAKELGVPVTTLDDMPEHWIHAAMVSLELRRIEAERDSGRS